MGNFRVIFGFIHPKTAFVAVLFGDRSNQPHLGSPLEQLA
jgi:hypothetical protein